MVMEHIFYISCFIIVMKEMTNVSFLDKEILTTLAFNVSKLCFVRAIFLLA